MKTVVCVSWEESERGWGVRPAGYSLHKSIVEAKAFILSFMTKQQAAYGDDVPDEYTRPTLGAETLLDVPDDAVMDRILGGRPPGPKDWFVKTLEDVLRKAEEQRS